MMGWCLLLYRTGEGISLGVGGLGSGVCGRVWGKGGGLCVDDVRQA